LEHLADPAARPGEVNQQRNTHEVADSSTEVSASWPVDLDRGSPVRAQSRPWIAVRGIYRGCVREILQRPSLSLSLGASPEPSGAGLAGAGNGRRRR
jgi:hypothetical protein